MDVQPPQDDPRLRAVPRTLRTQPPSLDHLHGHEFEDLLCALLQEKSDEFQFAFPHEPSGNSDLGVDIIAHQHDGKVTAVQCKAVQTFGPADIAAAGAAVRDHWEGTWKARKVVRFILAVTTELRSGKAYDQLRLEAEEFRKLGVAFEPWFLGKLQAVLAPHRLVLSRYLAPEAVDWICGTGAVSPTYETKIRELYLTLDHSRERLTEAEGTRFKDLKQRWARGETEDVLAELTRLTQGLEVLSDEQGFAYLSFAVQVYSATEPDRARAFLADLKRRYPERDATIVTATLLVNQGEFEKATEYLSDDQSAVGLCLKAIVLLHRDRAHEAVEMLSSQESLTVEARRLMSLAYLVTKRPEKALEQIKLALADAPEDKSLKLVLVKVLFYASLSPLAWPDSVWSFLNPVDPRLSELCTSVEESVQKLSATCLEIMKSSQDRRSSVEAREWYFASLCLFGEDAGGGLKELLTRELDLEFPSPTILQWAITYVATLDTAKLLAKLEALLAATPVDINYNLTLANLLLRLGQPSKARAALEGLLSVASDPKLVQILEVWVVRTLLAEGNHERAIELIKSGPGENVTVYGPISEMEDSDLSRAAEHAFATYEHTQDPDFLLQALRAHSRLSDWEWLEKNAEHLLDTFRTEEVLRDVTAAAFNLQKFERCLELLERLGPVRDEFVARKAFALLALRRFESARDAFPPLAQTETRIDYLRCEIALRCAESDPGDIRDIVRRLIAHPEAVAGDFLQLADLVRPYEDEYSRLLLKQAIQLGIPDSSLHGAVYLIQKLRFEDDAIPELLERFRRQLESGDAANDVVFFSKEDLEELNRLRADALSTYDSLTRHGSGTAHEYAELTRTALATQYLTWPRVNVRSGQPLDDPPVFFRNGRRDSRLEIEFPENTRLTLDLTSVYTLSYLNLLVRLDGCFDQLQVTRSLMRALNHDFKLLAYSTAPNGNEDDRLTRKQIRGIRDWFDIQFKKPKARWKRRTVDRPCERDEGPHTTALSDLFYFEVDPNDVLCVDDRYLTSYLAREPDAPIVTSYDVMVYMRRSGKLGEDEFFNALHLLRAANYRYVSLTTEELLHWLAPERCNSEGSTEQLETIKTSVSAALLQSAYLQTPLGDQKGEWSFLTSTHRAVEEAIVMCFDPNVEVERSQAQAYWLLENLYVDLTGLRECAGLTEHEDPVARFGYAYGSLLAVVNLRWDIWNDEHEDARHRCLEWLHATVLHRLDVDPKLAAATARGFSEIFRQPAENRETLRHPPEFWQGYKAAVRRYIMDLPNVLKPHFLRSEDFVREFDLMPATYLEVNGLSLPKNAFLEAVASSRAGNPSLVKDRTGRELALTPTLSGIEISGSGISLSTIPSNLIELFREIEDGSDVELSKCFDGPVDQMREELARESTVVEKAALAINWGSTSPEHQYFRLQSSLEEGGAHPMELLIPPNQERMLLRYRLSETEIRESFGSALRVAAQDLNDEKGWSLSLERLSVFPTPLPEELVSAFLAIPEKDLLARISSHFELAPTPLGCLHRIHILLARSETACRTGALEEVRWLLSDEGQLEIQAFLSVLAWSVEKWSKAPDDTMNVKVRLSLAWAHAEELYRRFRIANIDYVDIAAKFQSFRRPLTRLALSMRPIADITKDAAYLDASNFERWLLSGLAYACSKATPIPQDLVDNVAGRIVSGEGQGYFTPAFLENLWKTDLLDSWLGRSFADPLLSFFLPPERADGGQRENLERQVRIEISEFALDPVPNAPRLSFLSFLVQSGVAPDWVRKDTETAILGSGLRSLLDNRNQLGSLTGLSILAGTFSEHGQRTAFGQLLEILLDLEMSDLTASVALGCSIALTKQPLDFSSRIRLLNERIRSLLRVLPSLASYTNVTIGGLILEIGAEHAYPLWPALLMARAQGNAGRDFLEPAELHKQ